jgi:dihydroorotase
MKKILIKQATIINEGKSFIGDVLIEGEKIAQVAEEISDAEAEIIQAEGKLLIPGAIDDQVHFREPGLTHKANINTESRAAAAGGITSFMEMPNTVPQALTQELLEDKFTIAKETSYVNYSFFMGASNDNLEEVLKTNPQQVAGVKVFMGSSTGNMLVDNTQTLENIFRNVPMLIATHCEDEATIRKNQQEHIDKYGEDIPISAHPIIRNVEACYLSSSKAVELAKKHNARLHILHISTGKEVDLFSNEVPLAEKRITAEACVHHLYFDDSYYAEKGTFIKWNPAVKSKADKERIWEGLLSDKIDIIATDHAPHTIEEKQNKYLKAPSGGPLVQHAYPLMLDLASEGKLSYEKVIEKMCHAPAVCFQLKDRGYIKPGYFADLVLVDKEEWTVNKENVLYKCGWSPFEGRTFKHKINTTFVNGNIVYNNGEFSAPGLGKRLEFDR